MKSKHKLQQKHLKPIKLIFNDKSNYNPIFQKIEHTVKNIYENKITI